MTPGTADADLGPNGEAEWQRLRRQLEYADGFWLGFVFTRSPAVCVTLRSRTERMLKTRAMTLQSLRPATPPELAVALASLFDAPAVHHGCVWVEAVRSDPAIITTSGPTWRDAWESFALRLNERRDALRRHLTGGLVLALPSELKVVLRDAAPDLWSVRALVLDIGSPIVAPAASWVPRPESPQSSPQSTAGTLDFLREEARRRLEREGDRRPAIAALVRLAHALVDAGLDDEALAASRRARDLLQGEPTLDPVLTASTLAAVALSEWACGDSAAAAEHLDRAISLHTSAGFEVPAGWLNLCAHLALERLDLDAAERAYAESLAIARRLLDAHGDSPQALRDLSFSLNNVGQLQQARGDLDAAERAYTESLAIARRLLDAHGDSPQALRDLSFSLINVGEIQQARGDLDAAERAFAESLATRRRLVAVSRPLQQDLSDLMSTLSALANLHREMGHADVAASLEQERDALKERLSHPPLSP